MDGCYFMRNKNRVKNYTLFGIEFESQLIAELVQYVIARAITLYMYIASRYESHSLTHYLIQVNDDLMFSSIFYTFYQVYSLYSLLSFPILNASEPTHG